MLGIVVAYDVVAEIRSYDPDSLGAVNCSVEAPVFILA